MKICLLVVYFGRRRKDVLLGAHARIARLPTRLKGYFRAAISFWTVALRLVVCQHPEVPPAYPLPFATYQWIFFLLLVVNGRMENDLLPFIGSPRPFHSSGRSYFSSFEKLFLIEERESDRFSRSAGRLGRGAGGRGFMFRPVTVFYYDCPISSRWSSIPAGSLPPPTCPYSD